MSDLTIEQRVEYLEQYFRGMKRECIETDSSKYWWIDDLRIRNCPVCKHETLQTFESRKETFHCLTCGHTLGKRIVVID